MQQLPNAIEQAKQLIKDNPALIKNCLEAEYKISEAMLKLMRDCLAAYVGDIKTEENQNL